MTAARSIDRADNAFLLAALSTLLAVYLAWALGLPGGAVKLCIGMALAGTACLLGRELATGRWLVPVLLACLVAIAVGSPTVDWDARSIWLFHAKRIYLDHALDAQLDGYASWSHDDYPVLVPAVGASLASLLGRWNELVPKLAGLLVMVPALVLAARRLSLMATAGWLVLVVYCAGALLVNGYLDALLAVYFVAAFSLVRDSLGAVDSTADGSRTEDASAPVAALLVLVVLTLLKNEGLLAMAAILGGVVLVALSHGRRPPRRALAFMALAVLPILHWKWLAGSHGIGNALVGASMASRAIGRLQDPSSLWLIVKSMFVPLPVLVPISAFAFVAWRARWSSRFQAAAVAAGSYAAVIVLVYLSTPMDLAWHLQTSADRVMLPISLLLGHEVARNAGRGPPRD